MTQRPYRLHTALLAVLFALLTGMAAPRLCAGNSAAADILQQQVQAQYARLARLDNPALLARGERALENGDEELALTAFNMLARRTAQSQDPTDLHTCAKALCHIGDLCYARCSYAKAMEYYLDCLKMCEDYGFNDLFPQVCNMMGNVYSSFDDFERSNPLYRKALAGARKLGDQSFVNRILNNLICAYPCKEPLSDIKAYYRELEQHPESRPRYTYNLLMDKGMIFSYEHNDREAVEWFRRSARFARQEGLGVECIGSSYASMAESFQRLRATDSTLHYLHACEQLARDSGQPNLLAGTLEKLYTLYEQRDLQRALRYKAEYLDLADSIYNRNEFNHLKNAQFLYETDRNIHTIHALTLEKERKEMQITMQRRWLLTLVIGSLAVVAMLVVLAVQKRRLKESYNRLYERNKDMLGNEKAYRQRIRDLEELVPETPVPPATAAAAHLSAHSLQPELRKNILACIMHTMEQTEDFCDSDFCIERLAEKAGTNSRYTSVVINDVFGKNFRSLLNEYRIKEAMRRMMDEETYGMLTIKAISESVGYKSQSNFISVFTKLTGIKPSMFQKLSREEKERALNGQTAK